MRCSLIAGAIAEGMSPKLFRRIFQGDRASLGHKETLMYGLDEIRKMLGQRFGILAESNTSQLTVVAQNSDVAVGDLF